MFKIYKQTSNQYNYNEFSNLRASHKAQIILIMLIL